MRLSSLACSKYRGTVTVTVLLIAPVLVTMPKRLWDMAGIGVGLDWVVEGRGSRERRGGRPRDKREKERRGAREAEIEYRCCREMSKSEGKSPGRERTLLCLRLSPTQFTPVSPPTTRPV